jgi:hypothetical protein
MRPMDVFVIQFFIWFYFLLEFIRGLKPSIWFGVFGAAEAAPLQSFSSRFSHPFAQNAKEWGTLWFIYLCIQLTTNYLVCVRES